MLFKIGVANNQLWLLSLRVTGTVTQNNVPSNVYRSNGSLLAPIRWRRTLPSQLLVESFFSCLPLPLLGRTLANIHGLTQTRRYVAASLPRTEENNFLYLHDVLRSCFLHSCKIVDKGPHITSSSTIAFFSTICYYFLQQLLSTLTLWYGFWFFFLIFQSLMHNK